MKIKITGDAFVITSDLSVEDILFVAKNAPDNLKVREKAKQGEEVGNVVFTASYNEGKPGLYDFGITFGGKTRDGKGLATYTGTIPAGTEKAKEYVASKIGAVAVYLPQLEKEIPDAIDGIKEAREELLACITEDGVEDDTASEDDNADNGENPASGNVGDGSAE